MDPRILCSFGSARIPRTSDRAYGWEVIDTVASLGPHRGVLVIGGEGIAALRTRASRLQVSRRIEFYERQPLDRLMQSIGTAGFATSIQSFDLAGWVRTTGKLPLLLAGGKYVLATAVGEASRILPAAAQLQRGTDEELVEQLATAVRRGIDATWPDRARAEAAPFRRSTVAANLRDHLQAVNS